MTVVVAVNVMLSHSPTSITVYILESVLRSTVTGPLHVQLVDISTIHSSLNLNHFPLY